MLSLFLLLIQQLFVTCIEYEYVHDINDPLEDGEALNHINTLYFRARCSGLHRKRQVHLCLQPLLVYAAVQLMAPVQALVVQFVTRSTREDGLNTGIVLFVPRNGRKYDKVIQLGDTRVITSSVFLVLLLDEVVDVSTFQQEIFNETMAEESGEACFLHVMPCDAVMFCAMSPARAWKKPMLYLSSTVLAYFKTD